MKRAGRGSSLGTHLYRLLSASGVHPSAHATRRSRTFSARCSTRRLASSLPGRPRCSSSQLAPKRSQPSKAQSGVHAADVRRAMAEDGCVGRRCGGTVDDGRRTVTDTSSYRGVHYSVVRRSQHQSAWPELCVRHPRATVGTAPLTRRDATTTTLPLPSNPGSSLGVLGFTWAGTAAQRPNVSQCHAPTTEVEKVITARSVPPGFPRIYGLVNDRVPRGRNQGLACHPPGQGPMAPQDTGRQRRPTTGARQPFGARAAAPSRLPVRHAADGPNAGGAAPGSGPIGPVVGPFSGANRPSGGAPR